MTGIAVFDEKQSAYPWLIYRVVDVDQLLYTADAADCDSNPCDSGQATRVLIAGDGLSLDYLECGAVPCAAILHWEGVEIDGMECESEDPPGTGQKVQKLAFQTPLEMETLPGCPAIGIIRLASGLIEADNTDPCITLTVVESNCKYMLSVTLDRSCLVSVVVLAGTCISVDKGEDEEGRTTYTINNTMELEGADCIEIAKDGCKHTITNTMQVAARDCITIDDNGCVKTVINNVRVVGGNGIRVTRAGCTYSVNLDGSTSDPKTTLRLLCGVEVSPIQITCAQDYEGNWGFTVTGGEVTEKFTTIEIPSALIVATSDCPPEYDGTGGGIDPPEDPPPDGEFITINHINCDGPTGFPYFSWTFNGWPPGAVSCEIGVASDTGATAFVGPFDTDDLVAGQEYWGALHDQFGNVYPSESFEFTVIFRDANGDVISSTVWDGYTCPA